MYLSDSLSDELVKANEIYDKYDELRRNAKTQLEMNFLGQWGTLVWKDETLRLLDQLKEKDIVSCTFDINVDETKIFQHKRYHVQRWR